jgi:hypothetical protein
MNTIHTLNDLTSNSFVEILAKEFVMGFIVVTYTIYGTVNQAIFSSVGRLVNNVEQK